ncbi:MutS-related protein [Buchnera aphidicola]|uniref:MutS-related protein n=1 Tax=Buchnera aphidicola TaxID=9 RepID=UPI0021CA2B42|nr:hypothetical protein [Buchnera aphidicola]
MAWVESFVPDSYAKIGNFDKIFTRISSADNLSNGKSTFMLKIMEIVLYITICNK